MSGSSGPNTAKHGDRQLPTARELAKHHSLNWSGPKPKFFDGALLGNGGLGAVVVTRPDAVVVHLGHNSVWDERIDESHAHEMLTFDEVFQRLKDMDPSLASVFEDPWWADYVERMETAYNKPYPRPYPCGSVILGIDSRVTTVLGHSLDISDGLCTVALKHHQEDWLVDIFVDQEHDRLWLRVTGPADSPHAHPVRRVRLLPDPDGADASEATELSVNEEAKATTEAGEKTLRDSVSEGPSTTHQFSFIEKLPTLDNSAGADNKVIELVIHSSQELGRGTRLNWFGNIEDIPPLERIPASGPELSLAVDLLVGVTGEKPLVSSISPKKFPQERDGALRRAVAEWEKYWNLSAVSLSDHFLESVWYRNTYFAHCAIRKGRTCPGLFGNWSYRDIGTAWHGDYHMNYNTQQPFWGTFSSNRVESHEPYVDMVHSLLPISRSWARDYFELEGACFPHSAYPVPMTVVPYPVPTWGWEISETPWAVQSLWWHYRYTQDVPFLRDRAFEPLREAVAFMVSFMERPETKGPQWGDDFWHIFPTVVPEVYSVSPDLRFMADCLADLTLFRFILKAFDEACEVLETDVDGLRSRAKNVLDKLPPYPVAKTEEGPVWVAVSGENPEQVYNIPIPGMVVFPGEDVSLDSPPNDIDVSMRSISRQRTEGGNDLVFKHMQAARLGMLNLEQFAREIRYSMLGNGTCADMVSSVHGRYDDTTDFAFMAGMGIWVENFSLPAVINDSLLHGHTDIFRLFPNVGGMSHAAFSQLRTVGAFLVSAEYRDGRVEWVDIYSERGGVAKLLSPWVGSVRASGGKRVDILPGGVLSILMEPGETITLSEL